jgi:UDP-2,3-diacylglucosamine pyrophosphatase LpxH
MKYIVIGDVHGRTIWEDIVKNEEYDLIIFLGDYFDTHYDITPNQQFENFKNIIKFKRKNMDKVIILIGNHDFHYTRGTKDRYSGYQNLMKYDFSDLIENAIHNKLIQVCYIMNNFIFTHAGVTRTWCKNIFGEIPNNDDLENKINDLLYQRQNAFEFTMGDNFSFTGDDICQSPLWVRGKSLKQDKIDNFIQIVGHTVQNNIEINNEIIFIDTLGTSGEYLIIDNREIKIGKGK